MRSQLALIAAGLVVLGSIAYGGFVSRTFGFRRVEPARENRSIEAPAYSTLTSGSGGGTLIASVSVGNGPYAAAYNSQNGYVYVASSNLTSCEPGCVRPGSVSVIDGTTVIATIPVGNGPLGVGYDSGNGYIYVANSQSNNISVID